jgi:hypothetical protein
MKKTNDPRHSGCNGSSLRDLLKSSPFPAPLAKNKWLFLTVFFFLICCAKVGDPLPPLVQIPDAIEVKLVQQARDSLELHIPSVVDDIRDLEIYRECGSSLAREFEGTLLTRVEVEQGERSPITGGLFFEDPQPNFDQACRYQIIVRNRQGRRSAPSAAVQTTTSSPPAAPTDVAIHVQEKQLVVCWKAPSASEEGSESAEVVGYLVNSRHLVSGTRFVGRDFAFGEEVSYSVQSVGNLEDPMLLSRPSEVSRLTPEDRFPPSTPTNLTAVPLDSKVQLLWDEVAEPGVAGYFIYRGEFLEQLEKWSPLVTINRYVDPQPLKGLNLYYAVAAVDENGNESKLSEHVSVNVEP